MREITLYTDGSCHGNPGPGGYAAILIFGQKMKELSGGYRKTTNNRMELLAAIKGFEALKEPCKVEFYTDSTYVRNGLEKGWAAGWRAKSWRKKDKKMAVNADLWNDLLNATDQHDIVYHWVKGHSGNPLNERCDVLANEQSLKAQALPEDPGYPVAIIPPSNPRS